MNKKSLLILVAAFSIFMELLDSTILTTSLVTISRYFQVDIIALKSAIVSYFIGMSVFISVGSYLSNNFNEKKVFTISCLVFISSSFFCGISQSVVELAIFRFIQGAGAALMTPVAMMMVFQSYSNENTVKLSSSINIPALVGSAVGPFLGGLISHKFYWGWIFFINIPIGLLLICFCWLSESNQVKSLPKLKSFDFLGFAFMSLFLLFFSLFIENITNKDILFKNILFFFFSLVSLVLSLFNYRIKKEKAILDLSAFKIENFKHGVIVNIISRISLNGIAFLLPIFLQVQLKFNSYFTGFILLFIAIGAILSKVFFTNYISRIGFNTSLKISSVLLSIFTFIFCFMDKFNSVSIILTTLFFYGIVNSFHFTTMNSLVLYEVKKEAKSNAINIHCIIQQFSGALGVSVAAIFVSVFQNNNLSFLSFNYLKLTFICLSMLFLFVFIFMRSLSKKEKEFVNNEKLDFSENI